MVFISDQARIDLDNIVVGLLKWKKIKLSLSEVLGYTDAIVTVCNSLDTLNHHFLASYKDHKKYGTYVHTYKRSRSTTWYIVYDFDFDKDIFVNKIISNYLTIE
jgi:mRNA-degrading endonuclease YafQ of YafQ-DinJ toxin-antitoxin module